MKLKWKDIYNENSKRRYCEITGIKKEDVELESNSFKFLKEKKYLVFVIALIIIALLVYTFRNDLKILLIVLAFFAIAGICLFLFNYFKFKCLKDGLYVRFGFQEGKFSYDKLKGIYLSKFNDYSFLIPTKRVYSIVIRYEDSYKRIKELSFPNYFVKPEDVSAFLDNFEIKEAEENKYVQYERFKVLKMIGKIALFVLFAIVVIGVFFATKG